MVLYVTFVTPVRARAMPNRATPVNSKAIVRGPGKIVLQDERSQPQMTQSHLKRVSIEFLVAEEAGGLSRPAGPRTFSITMALGRRPSSARLTASARSPSPRRPTSGSPTWRSASRPSARTTTRCATTMTTASATPRLTKASLSKAACASDHAGYRAAHTARRDIRMVG